MTGRGRWARRLLPILGSGAILGFLGMRVDLRAAAAAVDLRSALVLGAGLVVYGAVSLLLEALALARILGVQDLPTAFRVKAASYLLAVLHYTAGMGALALLLKRRLGTDLGRAAGALLLLAALDLGILIGFCGLALMTAETRAVELRLSVVAAAAFALSTGFVLLRTPRSLGPLDRLRSLRIFEAAAATPLPRLVEVGLLRVLFVSTFIGVVQVALLAFGIHVPPHDLVVGVAVSALLAVLPIAFAGLGTGQAAFLYVFREHADAETLLACSLLLSVGIILLRALIGAVFAREYSREAREIVTSEEIGTAARPIERA